MSLAPVLVPEPRGLGSKELIHVRRGSPHNGKENLDTWEEEANTSGKRSAHVRKMIYLGIDPWATSEIRNANQLNEPLISSPQSLTTN